MGKTGSLAGLFLLLLTCGLRHAAKLNIPKVLLPLTRSTKINFTLEATEGCYRWSSNRPEVASVEPLEVEERQCSQRAVLQARSSQPSRLTSIILAEDVLTGQVLRCDAIVDVISEIQIVSTTRELHLEDSPLELKIHALDSEGNTFSTLSGLLFEWSVVKDTEKSGFPDSYNTLRILRFSESSYTPPSYISELERVGHQGDIVLVSGIKTGHAQLRARPQESLYKDVAAAEVRLLILENILLSPASDIYLLAGTSIKYRMSMPCEQYELQLQNSVLAPAGDPKTPVATLDQGLSAVFALQLGQTNILLEHKSLGMQGASRLPNSTIYVVEAGFLAFKIHPGDRWVLETGRTYEIFIEVFDKSGHKVYLSDDVRIESSLPGELLEVLESSLNGSHLLVKALRAGQTLIQGNLKAVVDQAGGVHQLSVPVRNEQDLEIYDPIALAPAILSFPWQPAEGAYQYSIQVSGGSGNFSWSSTNPAVAAVTVRGLMTTVRDVGVSAIYAHDARNSLHYGHMKVFVIEPVGMEFSPCVVEARVGQDLDLPLRVFGQLGSESVTLSDCSHFHMQVELESRGLFQLLDGRLAPAPTHCSGVRVKALTPGYTTLLVSYSHGNVHLSAKITIAAYPVLKPLDPVSVSVVTLGSSKDLLLEGGPRPWVLEPSRFFRNLSAEDHSSIALALLGSGSGSLSRHLVRATCRALGEQVVTLTVGNQATVTNPFPAVETAGVKFVCAPPSRLTLRPVYLQPQRDISCPLLQHNKHVVPVSNHHNPELDVAAFDRQGRRFDNFSSLSLFWESSRASLASVEPGMPMLLLTGDDESKQKKQYGRQKVLVHGESGVSSISVSVVGYLTSHLEAAAVVSSAEAVSGVSATLELLLVEDVKVTPDSITIYNHPLVEESLVLQQGSGHFFINSSAEGIADVSFQENQGTAQVVPLQPGLLQLKVHDLCLTFPSPATATIHVSDILEVHIRVVDKVEIGKTVRAHVRVLDTSKKPFLSRFFPLMKLKLSAASSIVSLQALEDSSEEDSAVFLLKGLAIGQTSVSAAVTDKHGKKISSAPQQIEVFPPFRLLPRRVTLIVGAVVQITSEGGPQPQSHILFSLSRQHIASVSGRGHVQGLSVGNMSVTGVVQAVDTETGKLVVVSKVNLPLLSPCALVSVLARSIPVLVSLASGQDEVEVEVVQLKGIRIRAPITRVKTGTLMPVHVMGLTSAQTPFSFGSAVPGLSFHWSVTKRDTLEIRTRHAEATVQLEPEHNFAMMVSGRSKGRTGLRVEVRTSTPQSGHLVDGALQLHDEIQIQVYEKLQLLNPEVEAEQILMAPSSQLKLQTNRDGLGSVTFRVLECGEQAALVQVDEKGLLTAGSLTGSASLQISSQEAFGVNQSLVITVKVVTVAYLRLSTSPTFYTSDREPVSSIPLGAVLTFSVHFHDGTGETIHSHSSSLGFSSSREDLVQLGSGVRNGSVTLRTVAVGLTLLEVYDSEQSGLVDFLPLPVQHAILPGQAQQLVVGDVVCFSARFTHEDGSSGLWSSSSNAVLEMDPRTGAAVAREQGAVTVYYEIAGQLRTFREVSVEAPSRTSLRAPPVKNERALKVLISTRETGNNLIGSCSSSQSDSIALLQPESSISCLLRFTSAVVDLSPHDVYHSRTAFDAGSGLYSCSLSLRSLSEEQLKLLSTSMTELELSAGFSSVPLSVEQSSVRLPVNPGIYADQTDIILSHQQPSAELSVYGPSAALQQIQVRSSSPAVWIEQKEGSPGAARFTVSLLDLQGSLTASISIVSSSSGQTLTIPVSVQPRSTAGSSAQVSHCTKSVEKRLRTRAGRVPAPPWRQIARVHQKRSGPCPDGEQRLVRSETVELKSGMLAEHSREDCRNPGIERMMKPDQDVCLLNHRFRLPEQPLEERFPLVQTDRRFQKIPQIFSLLSRLTDGAEGPSIHQQFLDSYQVMFFTLFALLASTAVVIIVCHALFSPREAVNHPAFIQKTPPPAGVGKLNDRSSADGTGSPRLRLYSPDYGSRNAEVQGSSVDFC
ncbi:hypothetical protein DNTS_005269, partial [Danionella cerebrum]